MCVRKTKEEFVTEARVVHGLDRYNYDKVVYHNTDTKVTITCNKHGDFEQVPNSHLKGSGCPKCSGNRRLTTKEFIFKAGAVHGDQYQYHKVDYVNNSIKVTITCKTHGDFEQRPNGHLKGKGCPKCSSNVKSTTEEFITKANAIHGSRYKYHKVVYHNTNTKVAITCNKHGDFEQTPFRHLRGHGCLRCSVDEKKSTTEEFVTRANAVHRDQYKYHKVDYVNTNINVTITCKKHGDFEQTPQSHLLGYGCAKCKSSRGETAIRQWLEEREYQFQEQVKFQSCKNINPLPFDFSVNTINQRLIEFQGIQHYEPLSFRSRKDPIEQLEANLARIQLHDAIKTKWCADNNVPLLVIPYWDQHRIPELLEEFLASASLVGTQQGLCHTRV